MGKSVLCTIFADAGWLMVLAFSDVAWNGLFAALGTLIITGGGIWLAKINLKALAEARAANEEARKANAKSVEVHEEVKSVKEEVKSVKNDTVKSVKMLDGATLNTQRLLAISTATVARDHPEDKEAEANAIEAEKNYQDHKAVAEKLEAETK